MGTRSDIIVHRADGKWHRIYCHWDGYLDHNGKILFDHYTSQKKVDSLVALGDISSLGEEIGEKHPFEWRSTKIDGRSYYDYPRSKLPARYKKWEKWCLAYGRDRNEQDVAGTVGDTLFEVWPEHDTWTEFTYVWCDANITEIPKDPCWWVADPDKGTQDLVNLGDALQGKISVRPAIKVPFLGVIGQHPKHDPFKPVR